MAKEMKHSITVKRCLAAVIALIMALAVVPARPVSAMPNDWQNWQNMPPGWSSDWQNMPPGWSPDMQGMPPGWNPDWQNMPPGWNPDWQNNQSNDWQNYLPPDWGGFDWENFDQYGWGNMDPFNFDPHQHWGPSPTPTPPPGGWTNVHRAWTNAHIINPVATVTVGNNFHVRRLVIREMEAGMVRRMGNVGTAAGSTDASNAFDLALPPGFRFAGNLHEVQVGLEAGLSWRDGGTGWGAYGRDFDIFFPVNNRQDRIRIRMNGFNQSSGNAGAINIDGLIVQTTQASPPGNIVMMLQNTHSIGMGDDDRSGGWTLRESMTVGSIVIPSGWVPNNMFGSDNTLFENATMWADAWAHNNDRARRWGEIEVPAEERPYTYETGRYHQRNEVSMITQQTIVVVMRATPTPTGPTVLPLSREALDRVNDQASAVQAVRAAMMAIRAGQPTGLPEEYLEIFAEHAIANAANMPVQAGSLTISQQNLARPAQIAVSTRGAINNLFDEFNRDLNRTLRASVTLRPAGGGNVNVTIDPSAAQTSADQVWIQTPHYELAFSSALMREAAAAPLSVGISAGPASQQAMVGGDLLMVVNNAPPARSYSVQFNRPVDTPARLSIPAISGDTSYQAVRATSTGEVVGGRLNPLTGNLDARVSQSDNYVVVTNRRDFADIQNRSQEMQRAIRVLAAKGVINGVSDTQFAPDGTLSRAQISALIMRMMGRLDPNARTGFVDVSPADWFAGAVGSAQRHGIMTGVSLTHFEPLTHIPRDQFTTVAARMLQSEMGYRIPTNVAQHLQIFADAPSLAQWSHPYLALAARENLIVHRQDRIFGPNTAITRGEAAVVLYRLYNKIW
ncbi:MAG: S-layer homology domain-containing protein [Defluviitaleaceae bacterium]|nr:S-layer homology domain-containing protein [Defluviitaleaceae bacterium]